LHNNHWRWIIKMNVSIIYYETKYLLLTLTPKNNSIIIGSRVSLKSVLNLGDKSTRSFSFSVAWLLSIVEITLLSSICKYYQIAHVSWATGRPVGGVYRARKSSFEYAHDSLRTGLYQNLLTFSISVRGQYSRPWLVLTTGSYGKWVAAKKS